MKTLNKNKVIYAERKTKSVVVNGILYDVVYNIIDGEEVATSFKPSQPKR